MKNKYSFPILGLLTIILSGCGQSLKEEQIHGKWQGLSALENEKPFIRHPENVQFSFEADNTYSFTNSLKTVQEAGVYHLSGKLLYSKDTIDANALEKSVELTLVHTDTLSMRMNAGGKEQILVLTRIK